jgi:uncharacterized protein (TIGR02246 family)
MSMEALDYEEIRQLIARYAQTIDFGDIEGVVNCFTPDAAFDVDGEVWAGSAKIREFAKFVAEKTNGHVRHHMLGTLIDGDGATARAIVYMISTRDYGRAYGAWQTPHASFVFSGLYKDSLVKQDGKWLFSVREYRRDGEPDVLNRIGKPLEIEHVDTGEAGDEDAPLTPLDREAIRQLLARYAYTLDFSDADGFVGCFTPEAAFEIRSLGDPNMGSGARLRGHAALRDMCTTMGGRLLGHARHGAQTALIEGAGSRAVSSSYAFFTNDYGRPLRIMQRDNATLQTTGIYRDQVVKVDGRWLFDRRTFRYDGWPEILESAGKTLDLTPFELDD